MSSIGLVIVFPDDPWLEDSLNEGGRLSIFGDALGVLG
jgi:hypothetical protein